jgi:quinone-modifying oxidoreductase subunit QmoB
MDFEEMAGQGNITRRSDRRPARRVAFLLCDGQRDEAHLAYSGSVASLVALKQATYVRARGGEATAYIFYEDMQTPGQYEYFYRSVQADPGILLSRGQVRAVTAGPGGDVVVEVSDTVIGGDIRIAVDLAVLATDMVPTAADAEGALGLKYLQGRNVPTTRHGYADSHFICFPYETRRTGIYSAGAVRQAMDLLASERDGRAASLKAIQSIEKSSAGQAVHPRVGDLSYPGFFMQKCTSCGRCTQECPFGALELNDKKNPVLNPNRCRRCGICMGACPVQIISFNDYSVDMLSSMIKAVEIPEGDEDKPRILAFACENDAYPALDMAGIKRLPFPASVRVIPVRCLGSVNSILVADAVSRGFDGVALLGCKPGEDYQCHFIRGSELLETRMGNVKETLDRLALEPERVRVIEVAISESGRLPALLDDFVNEIKAIGPNPMKGF